jgi:hypothetical protein
MVILEQFLRQSRNTPEFFAKIVEKALILKNENNSIETVPERGEANTRAA